MKIEAKNMDAYLEAIPEDRRESMIKLRKIIADNIPKGFEEGISYGMHGWVVPHSIYPDGYHCKPVEPLPFVSIASQKNFIAVYHMGLYANPKLMDWFVNEYPKHVSRKLDMGKSCIRFKKPNEIPFELIGELMTKMTCEEWIKLYDTRLKK